MSAKEVELQRLNNGKVLVEQRLGEMLKNKEREQAVSLDLNYSTCSFPTVVFVEVMSFYLWGLCAKVIMASRFFRISAVFGRAQFRKSKRGEV